MLNKDDQQINFENMSEEEQDKYLADPEGFKPAPVEEGPPEEEPDSETQGDEDSQEEPDPEPSPEPENDALKTAEKRIADGQRKITELGNNNAILQQQLAKLSVEIEGLKKEVPPKEKPQAPKNEVLDSFKEEYPEIAHGFEAMLSERDAHIAKLEAIVGNLHSTATSTANDVAQVKGDKAVQAFLAIHPDGQELAQEPEFYDWLESHPDGKRYYDVIFKDISNLPLADFIMKSYKQHRGKSAGSEKSAPSKIDDAKKLAAPPNKNHARDPNYKPKNAVLFTRSQVANMSRAEFIKNEQAITDAVNNGQFDHSR